MRSILNAAQRTWNGVTPVRITEYRVLDMANNVNASDDDDDEVSFYTCNIL